jgi:hypothetical protein
MEKDTVKDTFGVKKIAHLNMLCHAIDKLQYANQGKLQPLPHLPQLTITRYSSESRRPAQVSTLDSWIKSYENQIFSFYRSPYHMSPYSFQRENV